MKGLGGERFRDNKNVVKVGQLSDLRSKASLMANGWF